MRKVTKVADNFATKRIADCELSVRTLDCMKNDGLELLGELSGMTDRELLAIPNFGRKGLNEIRQCLHDHGDPEALRRLSLEEGREKIKDKIRNLEVWLLVIELQLARDNEDNEAWRDAATKAVDMAIIDRII